MFPLRHLSLLASASIIISCASQLAVAGDAPRLVVRDKGFKISFQMGPSSDPISLKGKTTLTIKSTDKTELPQDTYVFVPSNSTGGSSKLQLWFNDKFAGVITVNGSKPAALTGSIDGVPVKQSSVSSDIKLGN